MLSLPFTQRLSNSRGIEQMTKLIFTQDLQEDNSVFDHLREKTHLRVGEAEIEIETNFEWDVRNDIRVTPALTDEWEYLWRVIQTHIPNDTKNHLSIGGGGDSRIGELLGESNQLWVLINPNKKELLCLKNPREIQNIKVRAIAEELPLKSNLFETVDLLGTIDHLVSPLLALKEIHRVSQKDAKLIITVTNTGAWYKKMFKLLNIQHKNIHSHEHNFDTKQLINCLQDSGFKVITITTTQYLRLPIPLERKMLNPIFRRARHVISNRVLPKILGKSTGGIIVCTARVIK